MSKKMKSCGVGFLVVLVGLLFVFSSPVVGHDHDFPKCTIEKFYVPALNKASNDATDQTINTTISLDLRLKVENHFWWGNHHRLKVIYYDTFNITLYYYHRDSTLMRIPIGNISIPKFTQSQYNVYKKPQHHLLKIQTFGVPWEEAKMAVSNGGTTTFGVELYSRVRYLRRKALWPSKRHTVKLGVDVTVNDQGNKSVRNGFRLTSDSRRIINNPCSFFVLALSVLCLIL